MRQIRDTPEVGILALQHCQPELRRPGILNGSKDKVNRIQVWESETGLLKLLVHYGLSIGFQTGQSDSLAPLE